MDVLTVFAASESNSSSHVTVRVYWSTGKNRRKGLDVTLPISCSDARSSAELIAIRYLLGDDNGRVYSQNRSGINLKIVVSKGAIKKISKKSCDKHELIEYAYPILTRYADAVIEVSKDTSWFPDDSELESIPVVDSTDYCGIEKYQIEGLGEVAITKHALERYAEYCGTINTQNAWRNILRRLKDRIQIVPMPSNVMSHKLNKYGKAPEIWKHPDDTLHYVFSIRNNCRVLVTMFCKDPDELRTFKPHIENKISHLKAPKQ